MERKIGEIFEHNGEWYQCIEGRCIDCYFSEKRFLCKQFLTKNFCTSSIIFKKLEKVGEPYEFDGHIFQSYHTFEVPIFTENYATVIEYGNNSKISIEIKQTKEDMEEKKLNLKLFDLEAAKSGKPVCTRDGRNARIICFDMNSFNNHIIVALITEKNGTESIYSYTSKGKWKETETENDLMILPKKKEGWVNIYRGQVYNTFEKAEEARKIAKHDGDNCLKTIKVEWEE